MEKNISAENTFIAFDLETTGFNFTTDRIIEIGAVKVIDGKIKDKFNQLVNPDIPIPFKITSLTGISTQDVKDMPPISIALEKFEKFIEDFPLIAHNVEFDKGFIDENRFKYKGTKFSNTFYDTLPVSRIIFPFAKSHKLKDLIKYLELKSTLHRALQDAEVCAKLWIKLWDEAQWLDKNIIMDIIDLTHETSFIYRNFFIDIEFHKKRKNSSKPIKNISVNQPKKSFSKSTKDIKEYFSKTGELSKALNNFEYRKEQETMASKVMYAFSNKEFLSVEAGTGTGKTLAYLIPALQYAMTNSTGVIVSTNTKNLQEQLLNKDIPLLNKVMDFNFRVTLLKGRNNYLCISKYNSLLRAYKNTLKQDEIEALLNLIRWVHETKTGDISENIGFNLSKHKFLWDKLNCDDEICMGKKCHWYDECFLINAREQARRSQIVIVNHSLFFLDKGHKLNILPDFKNYIFDEAHNLEKIASEQLGVSVSKWDLLKSASSFYTVETNKKEYGLLINLKIFLEINKKNNAENEYHQLLDIIGSIPNLKDYIISFWNEFSKFKNMQNQHKDINYKIRLKEKNIIDKNFNTTAKNLLEKFDTFSTSLESLITSVAKKFSEEKETEELLHAISDKYNGLQEILDNFELITQSKEQEKYVYWIEYLNNNSDDCFIKAVPLNIAEKMRTIIYHDAETIIFSSATLAVENNFNYFKERMGLDKLENTKELMLGSPFDYKNQAMLIIPVYFPLPSDEKFNSAICETIVDVILKMRGKHLILFTSYSQLNYVYEKIRKTLDENEILIIGQGKDGSRPIITERFIDTKNSVLLGTQSFWEGVDFLGIGMKSLTLVKLPFPVPSEPQVEAQIELMEKLGKDSFHEYMIPQAITKTRQGFGRLIRSYDDRVIVFILDKIFVTSKYGCKFLNALPVGYFVAKEKNELMKKIDEWEKYKVVS